MGRTMAKGRQQTNPVDAALARLADLAGRGVAAGRIAREVEALVAGWRGGERQAAPEEVAEWLATMHEQLVAGASAAAEQVGDVDADEPAALRHAKLVQAALDAAVEAVAQAALQAAPPQVEAAPAMLPPPVPAVTIDPLAGRNPQGLHLAHPEELRRGVAVEPASDKTSNSTTQTQGRKTAVKKRKTRRDEEKGLYEGLAGTR
jgi:hypothetical protein